MVMVVQASQPPAINLCAPFDVLCVQPSVVSIDTVTKVSDIILRIASMQCDCQTQRHIDNRHRTTDSAKSQGVCKQFDKSSTDFASGF